MVHFYVQRNSDFDLSDVIPFDVARFNEGYAFDLASGIYTAPVPGIYHFDFSAVKDYTTSYLQIYLQVNDQNIGVDWTDQTNLDSRNVVSLSTSLRLAAGDRVNLYLFVTGIIFDEPTYRTHFSGWLVEEDLV